MKLYKSLLWKSSKKEANKFDCRYVRCCKPEEWCSFKEPEWYKIDGLSAV